MSLVIMSTLALNISTNILKLGVFEVGRRDGDDEADNDVDMHEKIRKGESSSSLEQRGSPLLPLSLSSSLPRIKSETLPACLPRNNAVRLGDSLRCFTQPERSCPDPGLDKTQHSASANDETKRRISRSNC